ncbi:hypothetical protein I6F28_34725, partial [Bradyrhizobium sp. NBAIM14]|nr:hypothetical protein [Bradyrhizobium sp. NBAIM14]
YTVWSTDSNGNYTGSIVPEVTGTNASFRSLETTFQQDLNGDGSVGVPSSAASADASSATESLLRRNEGFVFQPEFEPTGSINGGLPDIWSHLLRTEFLLDTQAFSFDYGFGEDQRTDSAFSPIDSSGLSHITELLSRAFLFH